jgi:hypothetical protein
MKNYSFKINLIFLLCGIIIGLLVGFFIYSKFFQKTEYVVVKIPQIVKETQPVKKEIIVKPIYIPKPETLKRKWIKFAYQDSFIDISYWAYDSSADLRYEINGEKFMFPVEVEKFKEKKKPTYFGFGVGMLYNYDTKNFRPMILGKIWKFFIGYEYKREFFGGLIYEF